MKVKVLTLLAAFVVLAALVGCGGGGGDGEIGAADGGAEAQDGGVMTPEEAPPVGEAPAVEEPPEVAADGAFGQWDADGSGGLDQNEFNTGFSGAGLFGQWDADGSGTLDQSELETALSGGVLGAQQIDAADAFGQWDANADGALDDSEVGTGMYSILDADGNGEIAQEEFSAFEQELQ